MSESIAQTVVNEMAAEAAAEAARAAPVEAPAPVVETPAPPEAEAPPEAAPAEAPKPSKADRRFALMTSRLATEAEARAAAERRAEAAEALLNAGKETPAPPQGETVEQAATRLLAQREYTNRQNALVESGFKEFGEAAWKEKTDILYNLGATGNNAFMQALVEVPGAAKVVAHLADDADALVGLLGKSPVAMATEIGRIAAELNRPAPPRLSNAPRPAAPVTPAVVTPEPDLNNFEGSMKEWAAIFDKTPAGQKLLRAGRR
jgi:hypothetical protein